MNHTHTPKYRIELSCVDFNIGRKVMHTFGYSVKDDGKPSPENLKKWRDGMNASFSTHNSHLNSVQSMYSNAYLIHQKTGDTVAEYIAPMFEIV